MVAIVDAVRSGEIPSSEVVVVVSDKADAGSIAKLGNAGLKPSWLSVTAVNVPNTTLRSLAS